MKKLIAAVAAGLLFAGSSYAGCNLYCEPDDKCASRIGNCTDCVEGYMICIDFDSAKFCCEVVTPDPCTHVCELVSCGGDQRIVQYAC